MDDHYDNNIYSKNVQKLYNSYVDSNGDRMIDIHDSTDEIDYNNDSEATMYDDNCYIRDNTIPNREHNNIKHNGLLTRNANETVNITDDTVGVNNSNFLYRSEEYFDQETQYDGEESTISK
eukprot:Pgem_evm1s14524